MIFCLAIFIFVTFYLMFKTNFIEWWKLNVVKDFFSPGATSAKRFAKKWDKIEKLANHRSSTQRKLSIAGAFSLLEEALSALGHIGSLAEKLVQVDDVQISGLADLKAIQKECDQILRDPSYELSKAKADEILDIFERVFRDMELL
jgi:hypothetical protein